MNAYTSTFGVNIFMVSAEYQEYGQSETILDFDNFFVDDGGVGVSVLWIVGMRMILYRGLCL